MLQMAKDLVQDVFIAMWDNMEKLSTQESLLPYLYTVLRNKTLHQFEKDHVRLKFAIDRAVVNDQFELSAHHLLLNKELQAIIADEISKMPKKMKQIYDLKKEENFSIRQIAEMLDLSEQTVKNQLHTATTRLKDRVRLYDASLISVALIVSGLHAYMN